jgi:hypothetical protein
MGEQLLRLLQGQVGHHQAGGTGGGGGSAEGLHAAVEQGVGVREQHHGDRKPAPQIAEHLQHPAGVGAGGQGPGGGGLDHRSIGQGIAVGNAQLDQVGAGVLQGQQGGRRGGEIRIARHQEGHQGAAVLPGAAPRSGAGSA